MLYYEAMMRGQNPQDLAKFYEENNMFPAIKMTILENKVLNHILDSTLKNASDSSLQDSRSKSKQSKKSESKN